jgi:hypothetical protein
MKHVLIAGTAAAASGGHRGACAGDAAPRSQHFDDLALSPRRRAFRRTGGGAHRGAHQRAGLPAGALGNERDMIEGAQIGTVDMIVTSSAATGPFVPEMRILDIPFLFRDLDHARDVLDSEIGDELLDAMPERGLVGLAWGDIGFRHMTANQPLDTVDALQGVKLRSAGQPDPPGRVQCAGLPADRRRLQRALRGAADRRGRRQRAAAVDPRRQPLLRGAVRPDDDRAPDGIGALRRFAGRLERAVRGGSGDPAQAARESIPVMREATDEQDGAALDTLRERGMTITEELRSRRLHGGADPGLRAVRRRSWARRTSSGSATSSERGLRLRPAAGCARRRRTERTPMPVLNPAQRDPCHRPGHDADRDAASPASRCGGGDARLLSDRHALRPAPVDRLVRAGAAARHHLHGLSRARRDLSPGRAGLHRPAAILCDGGGSRPRSGGSS